MTRHLTKNNFWDTDLSEIESTFLPAGQKVTDLSIDLNKVVPEQGSVLLNKVVNIDTIVPKITFIQRVKHYFR